jgi:hypothetical protein
LSQNLSISKKYLELIKSIILNSRYLLNKADFPRERERSRHQRRA